MSAQVSIRGTVAGNEDEAGDFDAMMRDRAPSLLAVARRLLLDESEARELVEFATIAARDLLPEFRSSRTGEWLQGLVVGLAVSRAERLRHTGTGGTGRPLPSRSLRDGR